jgi:uncharacterized membrane protein YfcA
LSDVVLLVLTGAFAGTLGGLFGIGGGIVIVPVLYLVFTAAGADPEIAAKTAVGTSLATILVTSVRSMMAHHKRGAVDFDVLRMWGPMIAVGAVIGALLAKLISGAVLLLVFAVGVLLIGVQRIFGSRGVVTVRTVPPGIQRAMAVLTGTFSALMGIGGGVIGVLLLTMMGRPMHRAVGTASGFGLAIAVPGSLSFAILGQGEATLGGAVGFVHLPGFLAVAFGTLIFAPIGARLAHRLSAERLSSVFGVYLIITAVLLFREALGAL